MGMWSEVEALPLADPRRLRALADRFEGVFSDGNPPRGLAATHRAAADEIERLESENGQLRSVLGIVAQMMANLVPLAEQAKADLAGVTNDQSTQGRWMAHYTMVGGDPWVCAVWDEDGTSMAGFGKVVEVTTAPVDYGRSLCEFIGAIDPALIIDLDSSIRAILRGEA